MRIAFATAILMLLTSARPAFADATTPGGSAPPERTASSVHRTAGVALVIAGPVAMLSGFVLGIAGVDQGISSPSQVGSTKAPQTASHASSNALVGTGVGLGLAGVAGLAAGIVLLCEAPSSRESTAAPAVAVEDRWLRLPTARESSFPEAALPTAMTVPILTARF